MILHDEVYSKQPIFLRERLQGTAPVVWKEFLAKYSNNSASSKAGTELGSFQLHQRNSIKPRGFADISIWSQRRRKNQVYIQEMKGDLFSWSIGVILHCLPKLGQDSGRTYGAEATQLSQAPLP